MKTLKINFNSENEIMFAAIRANAKNDGKTVIRANKNLLFLDRVQQLKDGRALCIKRGTSAPVIAITGTDNKAYRQTTYSGVIASCKCLADAEKITEADVIGKISITVVNGLVTSIKAGKGLTSDLSASGFTVGSKFCPKVF